MNANPLLSDAGDDVDGGGGGVSCGKNVRKPYTITKSRESWTEEEHATSSSRPSRYSTVIGRGSRILWDRRRLFRFEVLNTDTGIYSSCPTPLTVSRIQIQSHAQKYFLKVQKNGTIAHVPPPRPKRKAAHPYPQNAPKNVLVPLRPSLAQPSSIDTAYWDETSMLMSTASCKNIPSDEFEKFPGAEADIGSKDVARFNCDQLSDAGTSRRTFYSSEKLEQKNEAPALHGLPDFADVYSFIGSVFDPDIESNMLKLKEMDPINFETVVLLMRNLTFNLPSPDFAPIMKVLSTYDVQTKTLGISLGTVLTGHADVLIKKKKSR